MIKKIEVAAIKKVEETKKSMGYGYNKTILSLIELIDRQDSALESYYRYCKCAEINSTIAKELLEKQG